MPSPTLERIDQILEKICQEDNQTRRKRETALQEIFAEYEAIVREGGHEITASKAMLTHRIICDMYSDMLKWAALHHSQNTMQIKLLREIVQLVERNNSNGAE